MKWLDATLARRASLASEVEVRPDPLRVQWRLTNLRASDDHQIDLTFACAVRALDDSIERKMLAETLMAGRGSVGTEEIATHFSPALREAATRAIEAQPAEQWLAEANKTSLVETLRAAAKPIAFNCGVEFLSPFEIHVESPTLEREKIEAMQRRLTERRTADQVEHVLRSAELLKQFQALRDAAPGLSPGELLERVNPTDRATMLETLLLAGGSAAGKTEILWAVAGPSLVRIDPRTSPPSVQLIPLPTELGPLRSVQSGDVAGQSKLLVGAQTGVMIMDPTKPGDPQIFRGDGVSSQLGFNSVAVLGDAIWASHGDAGVVAWKISDPAAPIIAIRPDHPGSDGPKNLTAVDDSHVVYSAGAKLIRLKSDGSPAGANEAGGGTTVFITMLDNQLIVGRLDGLVQQLDPTTLEVLGSERRSGELCSGAVLPWLGTRRLLLSTTDGPVFCVGVEDTLVTQYASPHRGLRAVAAAADVIAGISADRQRLILWNSWDGRRPCAEVHIASVARHRAADICFA